MSKKFTSAAAFKASLEERLRAKATELSVPFQTLQLKFVIERLLARLFVERDVPWLLKGGFAMDLRFRPKARTTKDVDLSVRLSTGDVAHDLLDRLQAAASVDLGDFLQYRIGEMKSELTQAPGGGGRFPCEALILGKSYARFHLDVGIGDPRFGEPEELVGDQILEFAGLAPARVLAIPKPQQFAEKIHAYTFPWQGRLNTRTKDLVDLVLLIERGIPEVPRIRQALEATFTARGTHPLPTTLPSPPPFWAKDFPKMAEEAGLSTRDYIEAFSILERFWVNNALAEA